MIYVALVGVTLVIVRGTVFGPLRMFWPTFLECSQCVGFWCGAIAGVNGIAVLGHGRLLDAVLIGGATSFLSVLADAILLKLLGDPSKGDPS